MKGILLAGGHGTRFGPCSLAANKHLFPLHDQPVIYHPLALLMRAGIRDIVLVSGGEDLPAFRRLLGDGSELGVRLEYVEQPAAAGIADAIRHCESVVGGERFCVALGDNLFLGAGVDESFREALEHDDAVVLACRSLTPGEFGVLELDDDGRPAGLEEKPEIPRSDWVVPGLYVYPGDAFALIRTMLPSERGELEVSSLNRRYLDQGRLQAIRPGDVDWFDLGTPERFAQAVSRVREQEAQNGEKPGCPEIVAWRRGWLSERALAERLARLRGSEYGVYLSRISGVAPRDT